MFPLLIRRCDRISLTAPVTVTPNWSLMPGSPLSCTVALKAQLSPQVPEIKTVLGEPSGLNAITTISLTVPSTCRPVT